MKRVNSMTPSDGLPLRECRPTWKLFYKTTMNFLPMTKRPIHGNLSFEESNALKELMDNDNITIKSADKGGIIVIQDTENTYQNVLVN